MAEAVGAGAEGVMFMVMSMSAGRKRGWLRALLLVAVVAIGAVPGAGGPAFASIDNGGGDGGGGGGGGGGGAPTGTTCFSDTGSSSVSVSSPSSILVGAPVTLSWNWIQPAGCTTGARMNGPGLSGGLVATSGSMSVTPPTAGSYSWFMSVVAPNGASFFWHTATITVEPLPSRPSVTSARNLDGRLELFYAGGDDQIRHFVQRAPGSEFATGGAGGLMRSIAAETNTNGRITLVGVGGDGSVSQREQTTAGGESWSSWNRLDGSLISVSLARNADGRLEMIGVNSWNQIGHRSQTSPGSSSWTPWVLIDGTLTHVAAETNADGRVELFGINAAHVVFHRWQTAPNSNSWSGWAVIPGDLTSLSAARNSDGRLQVVGVDGAGAMRSGTQITAGATAWDPLDVVAGGHGGQISIEAGGEGRIEAFSVAADGRLWHRAQRSPNSSGWTDWNFLDKRLDLNQYVEPCVLNPDCRYSDVNGDRLFDLVTFVRPAPGNVTVSLANDRVAEDYRAPQASAPAMCTGTDTCTLADVNGDDRADAVAFVRAGAAAGTVKVALSTGTGFAAPAVWSTVQCRNQDTCLVVDMNFDHRADAVAFTRSPVSIIGDGDVKVSLSTGTGFGPPQLWSADMCLVDQACHLGYVNGDNFVDAVALVTTGQFKGLAWVALGTGAGFSARTLWTSNSKCVDDAVCSLADYDEDGRDDIYAKSPADTADKDVWVSLAGVAGFGAPVKRAASAIRPQVDQGPTCDQLDGMAIAADKMVDFWFALARLSEPFGGSAYFIQRTVAAAHEREDALKRKKAINCP